MEVARNPAWWVPVLVVLAHQLGQYGFGLRLGLIDGYLDPLLCLPVLLGCWLIERRAIFKVNRLGALEVIVAGLALALLFEEGFPRWQPGFVRDWWDYLAYAVGTGWFWWMVNPPESGDTC